MHIPSEICSLARSYQSALKKYLLGNPETILDPVILRKLGNRAAQLGVDLLGLAKIHEAALGALAKKNQSTEMTDERVQRSTAFFDAAVVPIEAIRITASDAHSRLNGNIETLPRRTEDLESSNKKLLAEIARREEAENCLQTSEATTSQLLEQARKKQKQMRSLSRQLITSQENERKRISRGLHDVIAQTLAGINMRLAVLRLQSIANNKDFHEEIEITQRLVENSVDIVHRFASDLRPVVLDDIGLIPALESHIDSFTEQYGIPVKLFASPKIEELKGPTLTKLFRISQEALTNIGRHSRANLVKLDLRPTKNSFRMKISDDGQGFSMEGSTPAHEDQPLGILGMRERAEMVGGSFQIGSTVGEGTVIRVEIPRTASVTPKAHQETKPKSKRTAKKTT